MLARRFTIVCLICMLAGMGLSFVVQNSARPAHLSAGAGSVPCTYDFAGRCGLPLAR